jgi:transposase
MRGKKGVPHLDPEDPPRRRANKIPGHGTWDNDRPPVCGGVGREGGQVRLSVTERSDGETLDTVVRRASWPMVEVNTDEWCGYNGLPAMGRSRATVCPAAGEWARDDDGDGIREVHVNTLEGLWTGLRNFLRPFRGVSKVYLYQYVAMFEWGYNVKRVTEAFVCALFGYAVCHHLPYMSHDFSESLGFFVDQDWAAWWTARSDHSDEGDRPTQSGGIREIPGQDLSGDLRQE